MQYGARPLELEGAQFPFGFLRTTVGVDAIMVSDITLNHNMDVAGKLTELLVRHGNGDWGDLDAEDKAANDRALEHGGRLLSAYKLLGEKVWIITEADRSNTVILLPEEY